MLPNLIIFLKIVLLKIYVSKKNISLKERKELKNIFFICGLNNIIKEFDKIFTYKLKLNAPELSEAKDKDFHSQEFFCF